MTSFLPCGSFMVFSAFSVIYVLSSLLLFVFGRISSEYMKICFLLSHGGCPGLGNFHIYEESTTSGFSVQILVPSMVVRNVHCLCGSCSCMLPHVLGFKGMGLIISSAIMHRRPLTAISKC